MCPLRTPGTNPTRAWWAISFVCCGVQSAHIFWRVLPRCPSGTPACCFLSPWWSLAVASERVGESSRLCWFLKTSEKDRSSFSSTCLVEFPREALRARLFSAGRFGPCFGQRPESRSVCSGPVFWVPWTAAGQKSPRLCPVLRGSE